MGFHTRGISGVLIVLILFCFLELSIWIIQNDNQDHKKCLSRSSNYTASWDYSWDNGPSVFTGDFTEIRWRTVYLVRHGEYHKKGPQKGSLTEIGKQQSILLGERLKSLGINFEKIQSSPILRARQTSAIISEILDTDKIQTNPYLKEGWPIMPVPTSSTIKRTEESITLEKKRMYEAFKVIFTRPEKGSYPNINELYICHGNLITYFTLRALQAPTERFLRFSIYQASITAIGINSKGLFKVYNVGDAGHLPKELLTR